LGRGVKYAASKVVPGAGTALGAANVSSGAASWATYMGMQDLFESIKDPGFILFILGMALHFFGYLIFGFLGLSYSPNAPLRIVLALLFLVYTVFFIFKGRGLLISLLFLIWYWFFGTSLDPTFFVTAGLIVLVYSLVFKLEGLREEVVGAVPIFFFYLDLGLISFFVIKLELTLTTLLTNLILFMPWSVHCVR